MGRWEPNAQGRLAKAAMQLFFERGFDQTTVVEIAERAGLTERTFFRYFADKREVLFFGTGMLRETLLGALAEVPASARPLEAVGAALEVAALDFAERREGARHRRAIIVSEPELQERELIKLATLAAALTEALRQRGVEDLPASLAAEAGMAVFKVAFERWLNGPDEHDLVYFIREALGELQVVTRG